MKKLAIERQKFSQKVAIVLVLIMFGEILTPTLTFALTGGPGAPEFSSFEPVSTTNMVNEFSGDFTYNIPVLNIPGANGGGYAMSLSYHAGETLESEASWVGYGWTLNPGSINRGKKGFADDTKNTHTFYNDVPKNWTVSVGGMIGNPEVYSLEAVPVSINASIRYNNYRGFGYTAGAGISTRNGLVSLGYSVSDGSGSFSAHVNPAGLLNTKAAREKRRADMKKYYDAKDMCEEDAKDVKESLKKEREGQKNSLKSTAMNSLGSAVSAYGMYLLSDQQHPSAVTPYTGFSVGINFNGQVDPTPLELGFQFGLNANYNQQENAAVSSRLGCGYLYSSDAYEHGSMMMDYSVEKESMYNKRDRYLSIPFNAADGFSISGEGLSGGFKFHSRDAGHFRPNTARSQTDIVQLAGSVHVGLFYGGGFTAGYGQQILNVDGELWDGRSSSSIESRRFKNKDDEDESFFLRYSGDLGGDVIYGNDDFVTGALISANDVPGLKSYVPIIGNGSSSKLTSQISTESGVVSRSGRSSYIAYHTNQEMTSGSSTTPAAYEKSNTIVQNANGTAISINRASYQDQIGEIATINEEGNTYVYGLPVRVKNETNLSYDLRGVGPNAIENNFLAYKDVADYKMKVGSVDNGAYTSTYLLTQITTPDYVDRTLDGPTPDDFGGYTKFEYEKVYSAETNPYHYRMPYAGMNYSKEELSDCLDDMGSYSSGDKDVYYLKQIRTKTYTATFITEDRNDGYDAAADGTAIKTKGSKGSHPLKRLTAIELRPNSDPSKLIKKVILKYDYSLCKGVLNNINTPNGTASESGKLTLKELWFEYEGVVKAKISPYQFEYGYPKADALVNPTIYPSKYSGFQNEYGGHSPALNENPNYASFSIDAWGNYQDPTTGAQRFAQLKTAVNQTPPPDFDPAAWQLKVIKLPSGGEIHVQYEQDEYLYVQNRRATANVSVGSPQIDFAAGVNLESIASYSNASSNFLSPATNDFIDPANGNLPSAWDLISTYVLNVSEINVTTPAEKQELVNQINQNLSGQKIHFKFLYALIGINPGVEKSNSDYVTGYVNFRKAYVSGSGKVMIRVGTPSISEYSLPRSVCLDLVKKQKGGKLDPIGSCDASAEGVPSGTTPKNIAMQLLSKIGTSFFARTTSCLEIKKDLSYFKIPVLKPKKGGGLRVKRILMYDKNGVDTGVPALYGTEYLYQAEDGTGSGVATNEPATIRDENALVTFLAKRQEKNWAEKIVAGQDKEQFEGPIGETLLPSPSVGYSRVIAKNIHNGKTNTGFVVSEFNTVKDFPFDMSYPSLGDASGVDQTTMENEKDWLVIPALFVNYSVTNKWAAQGYRFFMNEMNGQPKTIATYAGDYVNGDLQAFYKSSSTEYQYFQPGESVPVMNPDGSINPNAKPGKEMEVAFEMKQVEDKTTDGSVEFDFGVGIAVVIPLFGASFLPTLSYTESKLRTHTTSKVIHYPVIQKAVITSQDGITHKVENTVFSAYTGKPLVTKTTDGYDNLSPNGQLHNGTYTSNSIPAYSQYKEMGPKAINERFVINTTKAPWNNLIINYSDQAGVKSLDFTATSGSVCDAMRALTKGDLVRLNNGSNSYFYIDETHGSSITVLPVTRPTIASVSNTNITNIEIVKSGRTNQLNSQVGSYVTYGASQTQTVMSAADQAQLALRQTFANNLTSLLSVSTSTITPSQINPGLQFVDPITGCGSLNDNIFINEKPNNKIEIAFGGSNGALIPKLDHGMPAYLNSLMNKYWMYKIPAGTPGTNYAPTFQSDPLGFGCANAMDAVERSFTVSQLQTLQNTINAENSTNLAHFQCVNGAPSGNIQLTMVPDCSDYPNGSSITGFILKNDPLGEVYLSSLQLEYNGIVLDRIHMGFDHPAHATSCVWFHANSMTSTASSFSSFANSNYANVGGTYGISSNGYLTLTSGNNLFTYNEIRFACVEPPKCSITITKSPQGPGHFDIDPETGDLLYFTEDNPCNPQKIDCIQFCPTLSKTKTVTNVVASSATTFDCSWPYDASLYGDGITGNVYETGEKGNWRPKENYVFRTNTVVGGAKSTERNYNNAGTYTLNMFNWKHQGSNETNNWVKTSTVTKYSPNGEALEEKDALGIYSAAKFGYNGTVPYLVAQNSSSDYVAFESFENIYPTIINNITYKKLEDGVFIFNPANYVNHPDPVVAHSGTGSFKLSGNEFFSFKNFTSSPALLATGLSLKVWVKDPGRNPGIPIKGYLSYFLNPNPATLNFKFIAQTGEWKLYESILTPSILNTMAANTSYSVFLMSNTNGVVYIDDIRQQPVDAQVNAYVYDPATLRLLASFDDQHFGLYYQYNAEGKLVRKITETEKGMKTIVETQYHTPKVSRDPSLH